MLTIINSHGYSNAELVDNVGLDKLNNCHRCWVSGVIGFTHSEKKSIMVRTYLYYQAIAFSKAPNCGNFLECDDHERVVTCSGSSVA